MRFPSRLKILLKAVAQLGFQQIFHFTVYKLSILTGFFRLLTPVKPLKKTADASKLKPNWFLPLPGERIINKLDKETIDQIILEADEICAGKIRLFGGEPIRLDLAPKLPVVHWSELEKGKNTEHVDIKFIWEPGRFNWAIRLGQAYYLSGDEKYPDTFWKFFEQFIKENPVNRGPNWQSAQEVALRMIHMIAAIHFLRSSSTTTQRRMNTICASITDHASRIMPTISYAIAQNNNHILSEAAGLFSAGIFLKSHPGARKWRRRGRDLFSNALLKQIDEKGEYVQHSTNYHRMMLILAIWMDILLKSESTSCKEILKEKLAKSAHWLEIHIDQASGSAANLGHNDGSNILQFTAARYQDFRPVAQAASIVFRGQPEMPFGKWDDLCGWLSIDPDEKENLLHPTTSNAYITRIGDNQGWAYMRTANYESRPAHADQLHVDIWHRGMNIFRDAGTYLYNASPPWRNALASTGTHNTVSIDNKDQMTKAGRFLWLDWAQAEILEKTGKSATACHDGYKQIGVIHKRNLELNDDGGWLITDFLETNREVNLEHFIKLHWLAPDFLPSIEKNTVRLDAPFGEIQIHFSVQNSEFTPNLSIIRGGETISGSYRDENLGWFSPTYGQKVPAVSLLYHLTARVPLQLITEIKILDN